MQIEIKILNQEFYTDNIPSYATPGSAAIDLVATEDYTIAPGETVAIHTGLAMHIGSIYQPGFCQGGSYAGLILPRSGLGTKGLVLANTIGLIDEDYQGEIVVQAWNRLQEDFTLSRLRVDGSDQVKEFADGLRPIIRIKEGDRFAQLIFVPIIKPTFKIVEEFTTQTERNEGAFGSTGV